MTVRQAASALLACALSVAGAAREPAAEAPPDPAAERPAGEGVLCMMAIANAMAEVGRRCRPGEDPEFQAELARSIARFDDYVQRNAPATPADLAAFR